VKLDIPSGGDIDGCKKEDILHGLISEAMRHVTFGNVDYWEIWEAIKEHHPDDDKTCIENVLEHPELNFDQSCEVFWGERGQAWKDYEDKMRLIVEPLVWKALEKYGYTFGRDEAGNLSMGWTNLKSIQEAV